MREPVWLGFGLVLGVGAVVGIVSVRDRSFREDQESKPLVSIAMIGPNQGARIKELLGANRILVVTWGGAHSGYWVEVPEWQAERATLLLIQDAKEERYAVHFGDRHPNSCAEDPWITPSVNAPYRELLGRPQYGEATAVGACLRRAELATEANTYSKISRIRYSSRRLLEASERSPMIEEIRLEGTPIASGVGRRWSEVQVFSLGGQVHCIAHSGLREE